MSLYLEQLNICGNTEDDDGIPTSTASVKEGILHRTLTTKCLLNSLVHDQKDGVAMESQLGLFLADLYTTKLELSPLQTSIF